ncbi:Heat shock protein DnaJ, cysteine-rich domain-containing protein, partial [Cynara cardunculus var. scolymus]
MELSLQTIIPVASLTTRREFKLKEYNAFPRSPYIPFLTKPKETLQIPYGLPETAASVAVAATAAPTRTCDACGGSGICPECKGEGFVLKRMSDGSAEKARLNAKNMATRY